MLNLNFVEAADAKVLRSDVNTAIGLLFIFSFSLAIGLVLWHAAYGENPVANLILDHYILESNYANESK